MASLLADTFRKAVAKHKDIRMKEESSSSVAYSTGFLNFDFMNGTVIHVKSKDKDFKYYSVGIQDGCLVMLIGRSGCGKTTWAVQTAAQIVKNFNTACVFHDDIEGGLTEPRKEILTGMIPEELQVKYLSRNTGITAENFYERLRTIHDIKISNREEYEYDTGLYDSHGNRLYKLEPTIYILDSVALLMPEKYTEEEELSGSMSSTAAAKTNSMSFKRIIPMLKAANIILFVVNHINKKIEIGFSHTQSQVAYLKQDETLPGGNTIVYLTNILLRFDDNTKMKEDEAFGIAGNLVDITLVKSRNNRAGKSCTLVFDQNRGFDPELSLFVMLKNAKRIGGAGAYLYVDTCPDVKFSQKKFKETLHTKPEMRQAFMDAVIEVLRADLDAHDIEEESNNRFDYSLGNEILSHINQAIA